MKKAALITGASGGSGLRVAREFAAKGYDVFVTSRDGDRAQAAAELLQKEYGVFTRGFALGAREEGQVLEMFRAIGEGGRYVSALVLNSADLGLDMDPLTVPLEEWMAVIRTNLGWNFSIARQAAARMKDHGGGSIVFVGSNTSRRAIKGRSAYIASKGGIVSLAKALAVDWGQYGIRVNCVLPGSIKTARWGARPEEQRRQSLARVPLGDIADFDDLAHAAFFLSGDGAKNITGAELVLDGGVDCQLFPC